MRGTRIASFRLVLAAAGFSLAAGLAAGCAAARPSAAGSSAAPPGRAADAHRASPRPLPSRPPRSSPPSLGAASPLSPLPVIGAGPGRIARQLSTAEAALGQDGTSPAVLARQALIVQLACLRLAAHPGWAATVLRKVAPAQRRAAATAITTAAELIALTPPQPRLPPWRIIAARPLAGLLADYHAAQAATGVSWSYLAAINLIETDFGRIAGPSSAGARGPMQFMPATWASYGHGSIRQPRPAILAAARFLLAHHAATSISAALYAYNPSWQYVDAVLRYARQIRASPHALTGYYHAQVLFHLASGWVLLPPGYGTSPAIRPVSLHP